MHFHQKINLKNTIYLERNHYMKIKTELETCLKYTDETGTKYFKEGDSVICCAGGHKYDGKIKAVGTCMEESGAEPVPVVCLDTSKSKTSYSGEVIKLKEITSICKNPLYRLEEPGEAENTGSWIMDCIVENGFSQEKAENMYNTVNDAMLLGCLPIIKASAYALHAAAGKDRNTGTDEKDRIRKLAEECSVVAVKEYFDLIDALQKAVGREEREKTGLLDTLDIVSKCWHDLLRQDMDKMPEILEEVK